MRSRNWKTPKRKPKPTKSDGPALCRPGGTLGGTVLTNHNHPHKEPQAMPKKTKTPTTDAVVAHALKLGLPEREAAARLGLSPNKWHRMITGERAAALADLDRMAAALGLVITVRTAGD